MNGYGHDMTMQIVCIRGETKELATNSSADALLIHCFSFVDSCGGTFSGGMDDLPPDQFIEYTPIIIQWITIQKINCLNIIVCVCVCVCDYNLRG